MTDIHAAPRVTEVGLWLHWQSSCVWSIPSYGNVIQYCITLYFREHFIFAQIREPAKFAKIQCSRIFWIFHQLSIGTLFVKIGPLLRELQPFKVPPPQKKKRKKMENGVTITRLEDPNRMMSTRCHKTYLRAFILFKFINSWYVGCCVHIQQGPIVAPFP